MRPQSFPTSSPLRTTTSPLFSMATQNTMLGGTAIRPVERHGLEAVSWFLYDRKTGAIMGRTIKSWLLITIFYIIYYSCLAGFWGLCMFIFMHTTIRDDQPRWQTHDSIIGGSPALGVRPSQTDKLLDSGIFMFNKDVEKDVDGEIPGWGGWAKRTQDFLDTFPADVAACKKANPEFDGEFCNNGILPDAEAIAVGEQTRKFRFFDQSTILKGSCNKANNFGFSEGKPCIILKLNKIYGLEHDYYQPKDAESDIADDREVDGHTPEYMPASLQTHLNKPETKDLGDHVWVDCHGENVMDKDALSKAKINYFPESRGFSSIYYPYMNAQGYQTPLLAVQFDGLEAGVLHHIECRAYAKNIKYDRMDKIGKAHFEIMMHNAETARCVNKGLSEC